MRMVFDKQCPMPGSESSAYVQEWISKSDQKPESHKDPARSIFSAALMVRFVKSYMELSVGKTMSEHPAFIIGASPAKLETRLRGLVSPVTSTGGTPFYYSFDVAGWSPRMPAAVQDMSHDIWYRLTGDDTWRRSSRAMQDATIYFSNSGYEGWYRNGEANLEGYDGKEMTMLNVSMLCLSVRRWRADQTVMGITTQRERDTFSALLLAYIDDGMARMELTFDPARARTLFNRFTEICVETFRGCGFTIEPSKCFPSDRFFIFLNEVYLGGRHLVHGVRAAGTICALGVEKHESLVNLCDKVSGGVRGAVMAGLDAVAGTMLMAYHTKLLMREWVGSTDAVTSAIWTMAPRAWGGLGMPNALQLGSNTSGHAHVEGISTFNAWSRINESVKSFYLNMLRTPLPSRTAEAILMNPFSARVKSGYLVDSRVTEAVRLRLGQLRESGRLSTLATEFLEFGDKESFKLFADAVLKSAPNQVMQAQYLKDLADAHPQSIFLKFCNRIERAATVVAIVGHRKLVQIMSENRRDTLKSWNTVRRRVYAIVE